jgi:hypothetical protein
MKYTLKRASVRASYFAFTQVRYAGRYYRTFGEGFRDPSGRFGTH